MAPGDLRAVPHPLGHRIDLGWPQAPDGEPPGIRLVRREDTHPADPGDGVAVASGLRLTSASDEDLRAETTYYYSLFRYTGDPPVYAEGTPQRASATATGRYDFGGLLYDLLPAVYRRYDAARLPRTDSPLEPPDRERGTLRRYLDLPGSQLDQLYSMARAALALHELDRVDGRLLPLLAQWIGWRTDHALPVRAQRNEIRFAPHLYRVVGTVAPVTATVRRVTGRTSQVKEYVHNVARTNEPERLTLWATVRGTAGWGPPELVSVDDAHDGRAAGAADPRGGDLIVYHTRRRRGREIWSKRRVTGGWEPSEPLADRPTTARDPVVARQGDRLWVVWSGREPAGAARSPRWQLYVRTRVGSTWSAVTVLGESTADRRDPATAVDDAGGLWLFWREWSGAGWQVRYNRHDGRQWQLDPPASLPSGGDAPAPDGDLTAVFHPDDPARRLWLSWASRVPTLTGGRRWAVAWRTKEDLGPGVGDWSVATPLAAEDESTHDREPALLPRRDGGMELFWASTRHGNWALLHTERDQGAPDWGPTERLGSGPYTDRAPLALTAADGEAVLLHRSNRSLSHVPGTPLLDARYGGTTTVRATDAAKAALRGSFEDFQTYTYDTRGPVTRSIVGVFLGPQAVPPGEDRRPEVALDRLAGVLPESLPVSLRAVVIEP